MSWLEKLLPPKIQQTDPSERRTIPEGLWIKCPSCETVLYKTDLEQNLNVCPKCAHHFRIGALERLRTLFDDGAWIERDKDLVSTDPLNFTDTPLVMELLNKSLGPDLTQKWFPVLPPNPQSPYDPGPYPTQSTPAPITVDCGTSADGE